MCIRNIKRLFLLSIAVKAVSVNDKCINYKSPALLHILKFFNVQRNTTRKCEQNIDIVVGHTIGPSSAQLIITTVSSSSCGGNNSSKTKMY